ncbi:SNF2-related protein [Achromobacter sp. NPDC058515]|uniref:SNF2-related protein n=1 Tax=Achromobacter sp. NPDC058515 TaxID=3346533 RepID=UPI00365B43CE
MTISTQDIRALLDFGCQRRFNAGESMVQLQTEGVAALCNILRKHRVAYLADEVGLGKTMQALGVAAWFVNQNPAARILIVTPRENVQDGWKKEYDRFRSFVWNRQAKPDIAMHGGLRDWLKSLNQQANIGEPRIDLLRHPSFTRPVYLPPEETDWNAAISRLNLPHIDTLPRHVARGRAEDRSYRFNTEFAVGVNAWLKQENIDFDLIIVDEAQCLRNDNQTNEVLHKLISGRARNWLFLSATPAHSGVENIATILNKYPGRGILISKECQAVDDNYKALREVLKRYMIRRPRVFQIGERTLHKSHYRQEDRDSLAISCQSSLGILSVALVQKRLVDLLEGRGNRFRSGYMASFESLEESLQNKKRQKNAKLPARPQERDHEQDREDDQKSDFHSDLHSSPHEPTAPDSELVSELSSDFQKQFNFSLPHPKVDAVESDLSRYALGDRADGLAGGIKSLVFCRRISSVRVLRQRIMQRYLSSIETRCATVWKEQLNWETGFPDTDDLLGEPAVNGEALGVATDLAGDEDDTNKFRVALRNQNWLHRFRSTFDDGQRNPLFFEQNWFLRLCREGGISVDDAIERIPDALWHESHAFATRSGKRYRRSQYRYLVWHCLTRHAKAVFLLSDEKAAFWRGILGHVYAKEIWPEKGNDSQKTDGRIDKDLLRFTSLWDRVETSPHAKLLSLPGAQIHESRQDLLLWRQVLSSVLGQYLRLTDALLDLCCADRQERQKCGTMLDLFVEWLNSEDIDAVRLRNIWHAWATQYELIFSSAIGEAQGDTLEQRAAQDDFDFLHMLNPVVGVTGGSGSHKRAIQQFNTPGMPYVMIGTDTIREGVNLHLYCDRVMHYGLAWTPGDLEQRVGRVDRYFGRIERRLNFSPEDAPKLQISYPHLVDSVERQQIDVVMQRKFQSDAAVDSAFTSGRASEGDDEIQIDAVAPRKVAVLAPGPDNSFGTARHLPKWDTAAGQT